MTQARAPKASAKPVLSAVAVSPALDFAAAASHAREVVGKALAAGPCVAIVTEFDGPFSVFAGSGPEAGAPLHEELHRRLAKQGGTVLAIGAFRFLSVARARSMDEARTRARAALSAAFRPFRVAGGEIVLMGVAGATFADPADQAPAVLRRTAAALNEARRRGRRLLMAHEFDGEYADLSRLAADTAEVERLVTTAGFRLAFQPVVEAGSGAIHHYEGLLRTVGPDGGLVSAWPLIQSAETLDLAPRIDLSALELAAAALAQDNQLKLSVNVSASTARDSAYADVWLEALADLSHTARRLTVELTETAVPDDVAAVARFAHAVKDAGARFSIDDFGSGYTSFRNLLALRPDEVKIDGHFVRELKADPRNGAFIRALTGLARDLGVATVAEWVETGEEAETLAALGVDALQGWWFGAPQAQPEAVGRLRLIA